MTKPANNNRLFKILMIGDSAAGKSCLLMRFADDRFPEKRLTTIGIDFKVKSMTVDGKQIKVQVWDTAGQERYRTITQAYYRSAMGVMLVYDVNNQTSFRNCRAWLEQIEKHARPDICKILVGNKTDLPKVVSQEEVDSLIDEFKLLHVNTSALTGDNVKEAYEQLVELVLKKQDENEQSAAANPANKKTSINNNSIQSLSCCNS